jgi:hypothetical protein
MRVQTWSGGAVSAVEKGLSQTEEAFQHMYDTFLKAANDFRTTNNLPLPEYVKEA